VILTVRDGAPFPAALQEIWNVGRFDRLDLAPLPANETSTLLNAALGGSVEPDAAERLWKLTHGNALYLQNIVERRSPTAESRWSVSAGAGPAIPSCGRDWRS
jgi:hypothetical protein